MQSSKLLTSEIIDFIDDSIPISRLPKRSKTTQKLVKFLQELVAKIK